MKIINFVWNIVEDTVFLLRHDFKLRLFFYYWKLTFKVIVIQLFRLKTIKKEKLFGYKVYFSKYSDFYDLFREIFVRKEYLLRINNKKPIIIDGGANIGLATLFFKILYPNSTILSFEPDKTTFSLLSRNINENNFSNVTPYNYALSFGGGKLSSLLAEMILHQ